ncbi:YbaB/EbfC family nucleoid-associated protein [Micromonospora phytophila]|uniref:YbaB/EbfC family nucleoid-associated protein n=1 Tax=Micromonospora phytophila TaxID=709888 RepID=UPI002030B633|nr:YbaB/EbfC family nucleoid-associated protein [Micromonospora phytophila]MCM0675751.1 YbaB/EbfC family nucleoid-associated protein [Micromonospora phytophila]
MAEPIDPSGLSRMLSETMSALGQVTGAQPAPEPPEGLGSAADGLVAATVAAPGRLTALTFDPRVMRMASDTLADEVMAAVNEALADLREKASAVPGQVDLGALGDKLRQIQQDTGRQLTAFTDSLVEAQERLARQGGK